MFSFFLSRPDPGMMEGTQPTEQLHLSNEIEFTPKSVSEHFSCQHQLNFLHVGRSDKWWREKLQKQSMTKKVN